MEDTSQAADAAGKTIGEFVAEDYRMARVFEKYGIDFCCGGSVTLATACREKGLDPAPLLQEIAAAKVEPPDRSRNYASWDLPFLADYIVNTHHGYIRDEAGGIAAYARKIAEVHGARHPEVIEIADIFFRIAEDLMAHLREEEEVLFPAVKRIEEAKKEGREPAPEDRALIKQTLDRLSQDHVEVGDAIHKIRHLAQDYAIPDDVCNTFTLTYKKLKEFEDDLHTHVHLENNILFPKVRIS
ncbi:iron-sulfur cluster repair protein ScdA [Geotalea daltonii FRC-32]|uniref:Iron-sulfur cluster repair protein ScdA n=1 Tax=Geotalea daltonii (strain DSM 22248 / JCM 15807 / FRC-32) TaxID=316067 RepID=B9M9L6_GEODF|nr:iron-sulfur cluster repair di-iron protein [Geotalea daltonii]ACM20588.1 iron-sulfur cluster repair protein ScdA [Geotalea daltonii FRC-32]